MMGNKLFLLLVLFSFVLNGCGEKVKKETMSEDGLYKESVYKEMMQEIGEAFLVEPRPVEGELKKNLYVIHLSPKSEGDIFIRNEPDMQKITLISRILFPPDEIELNEKGENVLLKIGYILKKNIYLIREIQIQGHADIIPTERYRSNMQLAAMRAISVYNFLKIEIGIDPAENLMSIASFGEYKPVQRSEDDEVYDKNLLESHNLTATLKERNRRIELLIFYRYLEKEPQEK